MVEKVLIKYDFDYADEFNVWGYEIVEKDLYLSRLEVIQMYFSYMQSIHIDDSGHGWNKWYELEKYFGTNEYITFTLEDINNGFFKSEDIHSDSVELIEQLLGDFMGVAPFFKDVYYRIIEDCEEIEDVIGDLVEEEQNKLIVKWFNELMQAK